MPHDLHGVVDLSALARPAQGEATAGRQPPASDVVLDVTEADFADVVQRSTEVPVLIVLWAADDPGSSALAARLAELTEQLQGQVLLARIDVRAAPQVAQAVGSQTGSTVAAVIRGQALPLPPLDQASPEQLRSVVDQVLQTAQANGVTGSVDVAAGDGDEPEAEPELPPLHQKAFDAIEADDLDTAVDAYETALAQDPRDEVARAGLAQVNLLRRIRGVDPATTRARAAADPSDVDAQLAVADLDVAAGAIEDAFTRVLDVVRATTDPVREQARARLVDLFTVVGDTDPRVATARRALANALY